jgi:hypothetical protein
MVASIGLAGSAGAMQRFAAIERLLLPEAIYERNPVIFA